MAIDPIFAAASPPPISGLHFPSALVGIGRPTLHTALAAHLWASQLLAPSFFSPHSQTAFTTTAFLALLLVVAALRLAELRISRRNQRRLSAQGATRARDPVFPWMAALHTAVLVGAACEVIFLRRPFLPLLALIAGIFFLAANALRWWVISTLGNHWNVQVMDARGVGIVTSGPYRWIRHPNYVAVFVEMLALPLIHTAWLTAAFGSAAHLLVLRFRVRAEDAVLLSNPSYRAQMGAKPRFLPRFSSILLSRRPPLPGNSSR